MDQSLGSGRGLIGADRGEELSPPRSSLLPESLRPGWGETAKLALDSAIKRLESPLPQAQAIDRMVSVWKDRSSDRHGGRPRADYGEPHWGTTLQNLYQELQG